MEVEKIADDLIVGAKSIAAEIGLTERQVYNLLETKALPGFKFGSKWASKRSIIRAHIDSLASA
jgi:hypothetical protein